MNFRIENENPVGYILQLGDVLVSCSNELCSVIADFDNGKPIKYFIRGVFAPRRICNISADSLEDLTNDANTFNYKIFSKDDFELILNHLQ